MRRDRFGAWIAVWALSASGCGGDWVFQSNDKDETTDETVRTRTLTGTLVEPDDLGRVLDDLIRAPGDRGEALPEAPPNQPPPKQPAPSSGPK